VVKAPLLRGGKKAPNLCLENASSLDVKNKEKFAAKKEAQEKGITFFVDISIHHSSKISKGGKKGGVRAGKLSSGGKKEKSSTIVNSPIASEKTRRDYNQKERNCWKKKKGDCPGLQTEGGRRKKKSKRPGGKGGEGMRAERLKNPQECDTRESLPVDGTGGK